MFVNFFISSNNAEAGVVVPCGGLSNAATCANANGETKSEGGMPEEKEIIPLNVSYGAGGGGGGFDGVTSGSGGNGQGGFVYIWY